MTSVSRNLSIYGTSFYHSVSANTLSAESRTKHGAVGVGYEVLISRSLGFVIILFGVVMGYHGRWRLDVSADVFGSYERY